MASVVFIVMATAFWATVMSIYHILSSDEVQQHSHLSHASQPNHLRVLPKQYLTADEVRRDHSAAVSDICRRTHVMSLDLKFHSVHTLSNMLSPGECEYIIEEAERHAAKKGWHTKRHSYYATVDLELTEIPTLSYYAMNKVYGSILPLFNERYGLPKGLLGVNEIFIVKYATGEQTHLDAHLDGGEFSFIIPLNNNFTGGGTTFPSLAITENSTTVHYPHTSNLPPSPSISSTPVLHMQPDVGTLVMFCGQKRHKGDVITSGVRYILVGQLGFQSFYACDTLYDTEHRRPATVPKAKSVTQPIPAQTAKNNEQKRNISSSVKPGAQHGKDYIPPHGENKNDDDDDDDDHEQEMLLNAVVHKLDELDIEEIQLARIFRDN